MENKERIEKEENEAEVLLFILRRVAGVITGYANPDGSLEIEMYDRNALAYFERLNGRGFKMDIDSSKAIIIPADQVSRILKSMMENLFENYPKRRK